MARAIAKIIIQGASKSFKSTLARIIEVALKRDGIKTENKDFDLNLVDNSYVFSGYKIEKLIAKSLEEPVQIEVITTCREPKGADAYEAVAT